MVCFRIVAVPGNSGQIFNNCRFATKNPVKQSGFSDVWAPNQRHSGLHGNSPYPKGAAVYQKRAPMPQNQMIKGNVGASCWYILPDRCMLVAVMVHDEVLF
ncbi:MAG: hypothetical protein BWX66_01849 [Deltaproteobacteria bacterium ADurb.Bin058]|nr:MAG: hypothetical protein BWX66_01849 [Deltaproteobacteria bacterium ADurb.Bin058]